MLIAWSLADGTNLEGSGSRAGSWWWGAHFVQWQNMSILFPECHQANGLWHMFLSL